MYFEIIRQKEAEVWSNPTCASVFVEALGGKYAYFHFNETSIVPVTSPRIWMKNHNSSKTKKTARNFRIIKWNDKKITNNFIAIYLHWTVQMYPLWVYHATMEWVALLQPLDIRSLQDQCHRKCRWPVAASRDILTMQWILPFVDCLVSLC